MGDPITLAGIVITGVISLFDLVVNVFQICGSGRCKSDCCGCFTFTHTSEEASKNDISKSTVDVIVEAVRDSGK